MPATTSLRCSPRSSTNTRPWHAADRAGSRLPGPEAHLKDSTSDAPPNGIVIAGTSLNTLRVTRTGELSSWKGPPTRHRAPGHAHGVPEVSDSGCDRAGRGVRGQPGLQRTDHRPVRDRPASRRPRVAPAALSAGEPPYAYRQLARWLARSAFQSGACARSGAPGGDRPGVLSRPDRLAHGGADRPHADRARFAPQRQSGVRTSHRSTGQLYVPRGAVENPQAVCTLHHRLTRALLEQPQPCREPRSSSPRILTVPAA